LYYYSNVILDIHCYLGYKTRMIQSAVDMRKKAQKVKVTVDVQTVSRSVF